MANIIKKNDKFNYLTFVGFTVNRTKDYHLIGTFQCECGLHKDLPISRVVNGNIKSCGHIKGKNIKHGMRYTDEYTAWQSIKARMLNKNSKDYHRYGDRIDISSSIRNNFMSFYNEVGVRPSKLHSIDRIDNNKGYVEGNLKWSTVTEQANNRRSSIRVKKGDDIITVSRLADEMGLSYGATYQRLTRGQIKGVKKCV